MDDEDPDSYLLKAMSPLYHKCAKVTGKPSRLSKSRFMLSRGYRQEFAYPKMHSTERCNVKRSAFRRLLSGDKEFH